MYETNYGVDEHGPQLAATAWRPDAQTALHNSYLARFRKRMGWRDRNGAKPCPFCREPRPSATLADTTAQITCRNCYAAGPCVLQGGPNRLISAVLLWNNRGGLGPVALAALATGVIAWASVLGYGLWVLAN